ncbi:MAG: peptidoglycan editing factor PgeF [Coriobacteriales bacterium]|nr:peptidoglycan editing factor PgeF [Coriobacteriales bacterium]
MTGEGLVRAERGSIVYWTDPDMRERGILVAFPERSGGVSQPPYSSLNLASHVGDDPAAVDGNRGRLLAAFGLDDLRERLVTAEQVHGTEVVAVDNVDAGRGAFASAGRQTVEGVDGLMTRTPDLPLLLLFADCVPIVLVEPDAPAVAVVHSGWRGALAGIPALAVAALSRDFGVEASRLHAYVGAHIGGCCYQVGDEILSQFANTFVTVAPVESDRLDLGAVVTESLTGAGVLASNVSRLGTCTAEATDRFFSYRAEGGVTGRHGAFVCILGTERLGR